MTNNKRSLLKINYRRPRLRSLIAYDPSNATKFHDMRYYLAYQEDIKTAGHKAAVKKRISTSNKKIVTDMIYYYKQHAESYKASAWKVLDRIYKRNLVAAQKNEPPPVHSDIMGLVASLPLLVVAYAAVRRNRGATTLAYTLSPDKESRLTPSQLLYLRRIFPMPDGISADILRETSRLLKCGQYPWGASRRIWIDKPGSKEKASRPITIPPFMDRVVQTALKMVLEAIYEPWFEKNNRSFGFRSNKGCHDAIFALTTPMTKISRYAIEGDFKKAYDSVDKKILLSILSKRIRDKKFLSLMDGRLNYQFFDTKSCHYVDGEPVGIPQGGSDSPYLFNIYLSEFDDYVIRYTSELAAKLNAKIQIWDSLKDARPLRKRVEVRLNWLKRNKMGHNRFMTVEERHAVVKEIRLLRHGIRKMPSSDPSHQDLKFMYVRYADDWIILSNAPLMLLDKVKTHLSSWALQNLGMTLSQEKTLVTDIVKGCAHFLGFEIKGSRFRQIKRIQAAVGRSRKRSKHILKKVSGQLIHAYPDRQRLISRLCMKGYCDVRGFPRELPFLTNFDAHTIISRYNAVITGLFNYYVGFIRYDYYMSRWFYILKYSCLKTLAQKFRLSVRAVLRQFKVNTKYGPTIGCVVNMKIGSENFSKSWRLLTYGEALENSRSTSHYEDVKNSFWSNEKGTAPPSYPYKSGSVPNVKTENFLDKINWVNVRTQAGIEMPCALCGALGQIEMHHVKHIRKEKVSSAYTPWKQAMLLRNRKQIPLCPKCHRMVHSSENKYTVEEFHALVPFKKPFDNRTINIEAYVKRGKVYGSKSLQDRGWNKVEIEGGDD